MTSILDGTRATSIEPRGPSAHRSGTRVLPAVVVLLLATLSAASVIGYLDATMKQRRQNVLLHEVRDARTLMQALVDTQAALRGYVLTGRPTCLQSYYAAVATLAGDARPAIAALDAQSPGGHAVSQQLLAEAKLWNDIIADVGTGAQLSAIALLGTHNDKSGMDALRATVDQYMDARMAAWESRRRALEVEQNLLLMLNAAVGIVTVFVLLTALRRGRAESALRELALQQALQSRAQAIAGREEVRQIFAMAEALQAANGLLDGAAILRASASQLLPDLGGALYLFSHLRDRLDLMIAWDAAESSALNQPPPIAPAFIAPDDCWALKRGKPQLNATSPGALRCCHAPARGSSLEVPLVGRNEPLGLLVLTAAQPDGAPRLERAGDIARALADSTSLALSSIMLREKLRHQAVRDSLTGLYNRRFLEEVLQNLTLQAQRRHSSLAAIMIDLDHFKRLNDEHGHAMGDTVLRSVAATITAALRGSDVACRYGGEEMVVLLPDCTLEMARGKAEQLRERIAGLTRPDGPNISASLGIAAFPGTATEGEALLASADAALYVAKREGRNRVVAAPPLPRPALPPPGDIAADWRAAITPAALELASPRLTQNQAGQA
jgi:diguanylate cyclase (GGDEF)-like protein